MRNKYGWDKREKTTDEINEEHLEKIANFFDRIKST
jgi:hypothetical protein